MCTLGIRSDMYVQGCTHTHDMYTHVLEDKNMHKHTVVILYATKNDVCKLHWYTVSLQVTNMYSHAILRDLQ